VNAPSQATLRRAEAATWGDRGGRPPPQGKITKWTPYRNPAGTMLGFLSAQLPSGMIINGMRLMIGPKGAHWVAMPSEKRLDQEGQPVVGADGKPVFHQVIEFKDRQTRDRFQEQILDLLRAQCPTALDG
jgi:DNA-binding cell septation regulator SpoVG